MADTVVSFVLENLSRLVAHEANLLCGVEDKVKSLESELKMMHVFLKSCQQNQQKKEIEQEVVRQITDVAHDAEDVIDTFVANVVNQRQRSGFSRMLHGVDHAKMLHHVAEKIDNIKVTIGQIYENRIKYDTQLEDAGSSTDQELQLLHKRRRDVEEDDVVGFEHDTTEVINLLEQRAEVRVVMWCPSLVWAD
ncbi:hypothetical protein QN277_009728 [Acacia crassicarpa]|uniref:Disease resistance N-terminal domain-containing protein n=1 Tax=Acacia crassicarpa TaxID=499986 RepID=A0AAE1JJI5_9FABA|nr:hypothetical protein QN277_009728 [Acacia crassicarpa]